MFHYTGGVWLDITEASSLDTQKNEICGTTDSFSPFALFERRYPFTGFFQPVDGGDVVNAARAGAAIPVKFSLGSNLGLDIFATGYPRAQAMNCDTRAPIDVISETVNAGNSSLTYDGTTGRYTYVWKTEKAWANSCRELQIKLTDGETHTARFTFSK